MKTLWYIAKKDLLQVIKDKSALVLMLIVPLVVIATVGFALGGLTGDGSNQITINVAVSNQETAQDAFIGRAISKALNVRTSQLVIIEKEYTDAAQAIGQVTTSADDAAVVGVVIPAGASQTLMHDLQQNVTPQNLVQFYTLPNNMNDIRVQVVQGLVNTVVQAQIMGSAGADQVSRVCQQKGNHCAQGTLDAVAIRSTIAQASARSGQAIQFLAAGHAVTVGAFDQTVPGYAIFFSLFGLNAVAATILQEKEDGTFRRLLIAPIQKYALLGGKLLAQFLLTLAQLTVLFLVGYFVFKMHIGDWPTVILLLIGTSFAATGLGMALVALVRSRRQINPLVSLLTLVTGATGGAWWPLFAEPRWMQLIAKIGIVAWAMEGLNGTMILGKSFMEVLPDILALLAYGLICFIIALKFFRFQEKTAVK